ncbi:MAG: DUF2065 domain-containing protein [Pseudomonadota bacterium]|jgi:uncharacterized protein|nr:DUF2065 domain-containing protein [Gammaproteobacteria bacterium]MEC9359165.1 DUF2065 domain-containing protein [Pseudomonadota bacterium]
MWDDLLRALALVLVIEGLMPFAFPGRWRQILLRMASLDDKQMRTAGLIAMVAGIVLLQLVQFLR